MIRRGSARVETTPVLGEVARLQYDDVGVVTGAEGGTGHDVPHRADRAELQHGVRAAGHGHDRPTIPAVPPSPQTLSVDDRRVVAAWAADCAEQVLAIYEHAVPGDRRVRAAIDQTRSFSAGDLDVAAAVRRRGGDAGAAAREAPTPAARAAAYAAEQAAAVAHMGAHALGTAGYAAKASILDADDDHVDARSEAHRQVAGMTDDVARILSVLPALGENRSGPLGPGRLSLGHVGETIRELQRLLTKAT